MAEEDELEGLSHIRVDEVETRIHFELDEEKVAAIRKCLENGRLTIRITDVDLSRTGRLDNPYLYD